jgi:hypothetical protein
MRWRIQAGCVFLRGGARPPTQEVVAFIDANRDDVVEGRRLGVEPICSVLQVAPSTYYAAKTRTPSTRQVRDERLAEIGAVPSIDTVGDSYDNALTETVNGYY